MKLSLIISLLASQLCHAFVFTSGPTACNPTKLLMSASPDEVQLTNRRQALKQTASILLFSSVASFTSSSPAEAKKSKEPVTRESIDKAFQDVRDQLESPDGGVQNLKSLVEKEDFDNIMEFTKYYDLEFRKAKVVKARRLLTNKDDKDRGLYLSNSITFDLIGMNKASRPGQHDIDQVKKYFNELVEDITNFLEMKKLIDYSEYGL
mmetsp:Transcript_6404/g.9388  ORF Transcript_6404/g.9388 Transcript_6404/m.9388 type:complete len:207 (+) Transcript_6404:85-705(+)